MNDASMPVAPSHGFIVPNDLVKLLDDFNKLELLYKAVGLFNLGMDANVLNEYRYFARGLVDLLHSHARTDLDNDKKSQAIQDARGRAETAYSAALCDTIDNLHMYVQGCINAINQAFPTFSISTVIGKENHGKALDALRWLGEEISRSREDRTERKAIYQSIATSIQLVQVIDFAHSFPKINAAATDSAANNTRENPESWLNKIHHGLEKEQFTLHYQPKRNVTSHNVIGAEALLRWQIGTKDKPSFIPPVHFIPKAEESGAIYALGAFVLEEACKTLAAWRNDPELAELTLSVNVSPTQLLDPDFSSNLIALMDHHQVPTGKLELEITEDVLISDKDKAARHIDKLKNCKFSIDDFGKGSTEFDYLAHFSIDTIKIDRSILENAIMHDGECEDGSWAKPKKNRHRQLIKGIVGLAQGVEANVVLEGVEGEIGLQIAKDANVSVYQGYHDDGKPVSLDRFEKFVKNRNKNPNEQS